MKNKYFIITFKNKKTIFSSAINQTEAIILAKACMIKNGFTYDVEEVRETRYIEDSKLTDFYA